MKSSSKELVQDLVILGPALTFTAIIINPWWQFAITWVTVLFAYHFTATRHFKKGLVLGYEQARGIISEEFSNTDFITGKVSNSSFGHIHIAGERYDCGRPNCPYRFKGSEGL